MVLMTPHLGSNFAFSLLQAVGVAGKAYPGLSPGLTHSLRLDVICSSGVLCYLQIQLLIRIESGSILHLNIGGSRSSCFFARRYQRRNGVSAASKGNHTR